MLRRGQGLSLELRQAGRGAERGRPAGERLVFPCLVGSLSALGTWLFGVSGQGSLETGFLSPCWAWARRRGGERGALPGGVRLANAAE